MHTATSTSPGQAPGPDPSCSSTPSSGRHSPAPAWGGGPASGAGRPPPRARRGTPLQPVEPPPATDRELLQTLLHVGCKPTDDQIAQRLISEMMRPAEEGGRPHRTWVRQLPGLRRLARIFVGCARARVPISQAALARQSGLQRPGPVRQRKGCAVAPRDRGRTVVKRTIDVWEHFGLVTVLDDTGQPVERDEAGNRERLRLPPGKVPLYEVDLAWTEEMVSALPPTVRRRAAWAWSAWRANAPEQLLREAFHDLVHGEQRLRACCAEAERQEERRVRRERRAQDAAGRRRARREDAAAQPPDEMSATEWDLIRGALKREDLEELARQDPRLHEVLPEWRRKQAEHDRQVAEAGIELERIADLGEKTDPASAPTFAALAGPENCTPSSTKPHHQRKGRRSGCKTLLYPPVVAENDRAVETAPRATPNAFQLRAWIRAGHAPDAEIAARQFDQVAYVAGQISEPRPIAAWVGLGAMADRVGRPVDELITEYEQRADEWRVDVEDRVRRNARLPVEYPPVFVWRMVQYAVGDKERPRRKPACNRQEGGPRLHAAVSPDARAASRAVVELGSEADPYSARSPLVDRTDGQGWNSEGSVVHPSSVSSPSDIDAGEEMPHRRTVEELRAIRERALAEHRATRKA